MLLKVTGGLLLPWGWREYEYKVGTERLNNIISNLACEYYNDVSLSMIYLEF